MQKSVLLGLLLWHALSGCSVDNTRQVRLSHAAYNQVLIQNKKEELLLNLVRLRYRDTPFFLDTSSVTTSFKAESKVGLSARFPWYGSGRFLDPSGAITLSTAPTVSYVPIEGDEYFKNFLTPISLDELLVMTQSGWGIDRVFGIAVEQINGVFNATAASGPTPLHAPDGALRMEALLGAMRTMQMNGQMSWIRDDQGSVQLYYPPNTGESPEKKLLTSSLGLTNEATKYSVSQSIEEKPSERHVYIKTRSILSMLFYLSQNVQVPDEDLSRGLVTQTLDLKQQPFDWSQTPAGKRFRIQVSQEAPRHAAIQVRYRDHYFFIQDDDLETKSTFMLLNHLYAFQSGTSMRQGPALTLPVGG